MFYAVLFFFFVNSQAATPKHKAIKEAENLTILQDRFSACNTLYKAYKKATNFEKKELRERLFYFSKNYYTDKGFQFFLDGKELFLKEKFAEAKDKLLEADTLEKSNTEILYYLSLSYLWQKKYTEAQEATQRGLQINPLDLELRRNQLAIEVASKSWKEAIDTAEELQADFNDNSFVVSYFKTVALSHAAKSKVDASKLLEGLILKDKKYPETYYYLSEVSEKELRPGLLKKYNELCKKKPKNVRDVNLCTRASTL